MEKSILFSIILFIFCTFSFANGYDVKFSQPNNNEYKLTFQLTEWSLSSVQFDGVNFQQIVFDNSAVTQEKGWAELPFISASVQLPARKNVDMSVVYTDYTDYQLDLQLVPSRGAIYRNQDPSTIPYQIAPASIVDVFYPGELAMAEEPYIIRDVRGTSVRVFPFQYNAATNTLRVYTQVDVLLTENEEPATNPLWFENPNPIREVRGMYKSIFINYDESRVPLTVQAEYGDILVVTTARDETAIQSYIDWKKEKGYNVEKVVVATGTNVKTTIKNNHTANPNLMYVLLVGAWADIKSDVFTASCDGMSGQCPTDPMLGDVTGAATDYRPDISVGRMSATSAAQVTIQVNKTIQYEKNPNMDAAWYSTFIGIGSTDGTGIGDDNEPDYLHVQRIYTQRLEPTLNYNVHRRLYANESGCTAANLTSYVNTGASTIAYCGHGSSTSFVTTGFNNNNVNALTNGQKMPFIVSVACAEGAIQKTTCFAEAWLRKDNGGAVVTWMSTMDQPWQPPMRGQDYFYDILIGGFNYSNYPGQTGITTEEQRTHWGAIAVNAANLMLSQVNGNDDKNTVRTWTTFGDPSLQLRTKLPDAIVSSTTSFTQGNSYTTTITKSGTPVKDALVCISQNNVYNHAFTNENGVVTIPNSFMPGNVRLVVTAFNTTTIYTMVECTAGATPQLCEKPVGLSGSANGNTATITWNEPVNIDGTLIGYNVYRDNVKIYEMLPSVGEYTDEGLANGTYVYQVSAKYEHCAESELTAGKTVVIFVPQFCEPPVNVEVEPSVCGVTITWEEPENIDGTLLFYNFYIDGIFLDTYEHPTIITYQIYFNPGFSYNETHTFQVSAVYEHCVSELTDEVPVEIICGPQLCEKPTDLSGDADVTFIVINWNEPENIDGKLFGYNIHRDGIKINEELVLEQEYRDEGLHDGTLYSYQVSAVYEHCESELTEEFIIWTMPFDAINDFQTASFNIYPNPANNNFTIEGAGLNHIEIYDVYGRNVSSHHLIISSSHHLINVSHLPAGVYFVKVYAEENQMVTKKLVIMK